ncbi:MAG: SDR family oxidoreductase [Alphaproteobacteria bacterium]|nr:SDR family oxidoreductase [Alphaproteobacteria bacterium]
MLFCFGYGYVAQFMGGIGTSQSSQGKGKFIYKRGLFSKEICESIEKADSLLISIPPEEEGDILVPYIKETVSSFTHLQWIGYLSSTNVYGDHQGQWVNEDSATNPTSQQGMARLKAETQWLELSEKTSLPLHIFRLAGMYGPERNVLEDLRAEKAQRILKEGLVFSRIHIADIVQTLKASMRTPHPGRIYNIADNEPAPSHEVIRYGAELLGILPPPLIPFEEATLSPLARSFYNDSKRISNQRLLKELTSHLLFPTYREGLASIYASIKQSV